MVPRSRSVQKLQLLAYLWSKIKTAHRAAIRIIHTEM